MKNLISKLFLVIVSMAVLVSCGQRIDFDEGQWGDTAFLTNVQVFELEVVDRTVFEGTTQAARRVVISDGSAAIDGDTFTATVTLQSGKTLADAGLIFFHQAMKIEPLNGSPIAGIPTNLSDGSFTYRVHSADGTTHDWTVNIVTI